MSAEHSLATPPRCLLCDAGNTLVFLDCAAVSAVLAQQGLELPPAAIAAAQPQAAIEYQQALTERRVSHEDGWRIYVSALLRCSGLHHGLDAWVDALRREHDRLNLWRRVPAGLKEAFARLRESYPAMRLGVVSNSEGQLAGLLHHVGLAPLFDVIVDSGVEGVAKPDPRIFRLALDRLQSSAAESVYLGDLPDVDVEGARRAGLGAILVDEGDDHPDFAGPRVRSVTDLIAAWLSAGSSGLVRGASR